MNASFSNARDLRCTRFCNELTESTRWIDKVLQGRRVAFGKLGGGGGDGEGVEYNGQSLAKWVV